MALVPVLFAGDAMVQVLSMDALPYFFQLAGGRSEIPRKGLRASFSILQSSRGSRVMRDWEPVAGPREPCTIPWEPGLHRRELRFQK